MAYLGTTSLLKLLGESDIIVPYDASKVKNGSYELSLGKQVFQTDTSPRAIKNLSDKEKIYISPGQFALLLTEEKVKIPKDKIAFISIKAGIKFDGLVNVSGFHVDPGFEGHLLFSVYNAGPSTIVLSRGTQYFPIWFSKLNEIQEYIGTHGGQHEIPDGPVKALSQGDLASPNVLSKRIDEVKFLKTKIEWVVLAIFAAVIGITIKLWIDSSKLKDAIDFGYQKKSKEITNDSTYSKLNEKINILEVYLKNLEEKIVSDSMNRKMEKKQGNEKG